MSFQLILLFWVLPVLISFGFIAGICAFFPRWIMNSHAMLTTLLGSWSVAFIGVPDGGGILPLPTVLCIFLTNIGNWATFAHVVQLGIAFGFACWWTARIREKLKKAKAST